MYLQNWIELSGYENNYEGLKELCVRDSYLVAHAREVQVYLKLGGKLLLNDMIKRVQFYRDAHEMKENEENVKIHSKDHNPKRDEKNAMRD